MVEIIKVKFAEMAGKTMKPDTVLGILLEFEPKTYKINVRYFAFSSGYDVDEIWNRVASTVCHKVASNSPLMRNIH
jgi:hypothetical protein